jgi:hypothetical protein
MIDRTYRDDPYEYMSQEPCDYCIELECEHRGVVCPFYKKEGVVRFKRVQKGSKGGRQ